MTYQVQISTRKFLEIDFFNPIYPNLMNRDISNINARKDNKYLIKLVERANKPEHHNC